MLSESALGNIGLKPGKKAKISQENEIITSQLQCWQGEH